MNTGVVNIRGKEYQTVALRVQKFREAHPDWELSTEIIKADDVVAKLDMARDRVLPLLQLQLQVVADHLSEPPEDPFSGPS